MKSESTSRWCAAAVALAICSCTGVHIAPHAGFANTNPAQEYGTIGVLYRGGGLIHKARVAGGIGQNAEPKKEGRACSHAVLWLVAWGDSSVDAARIDGKIQKIAYVEYDIQALMGYFYHRFCTLVHGE